MTRIALGPASQKTVDDDVFVRTAALARKYKTVRLHTHLAENQVSPGGENVSFTSSAAVFVIDHMWCINSKARELTSRA